MASASRGEATKRKIEALEQQVQSLSDRVKTTEGDQQNLRRRVDRVDKCTTLVVEASVGTEDLFPAAEKTREFKQLAKQTSKTVLKELSQQLGLPHPLPDLSPQDWQQLTAETKQHEIEKVNQLWDMTQSLPTACQSVLPNKARSTKDATTGTWKRAPENFVLKLHFGKAALTVQDCLQGHIGRAISTAQKAVREAGGTQKTN